ncbi:MAG: M24 family metallopeptidase [Acidobacteria bacterium]|uniref:Xaa-Pro aminopeptidase n=1 Tax=Candidatus Polarisedimenticola svalbardensis TaxID=2886004 RepID=A0A8J7CKS2_9BACT|nr:M24 family metallopeptidase [Candidatus Polarisedimenticola svalbardensis]
MSDIYGKRRARLMERFPEGILLVQAGANGRPNRNFTYLTGLTTGAGALVLAPGGVRACTGRNYPGPDYLRGRIVHQVLLLPPADPMLSRWGEDSAVTAGAMRPEESGVDLILQVGAMDELLSPALDHGATLNYVRAAAAGLSGGPDEDSLFLDRVRQRFFDVRLVNATPELEEMRRLKEPDEIEKTRKAIAVTDEALRRVYGMARPGMFEYELEAEITGHYRSHGGTHAFEPIVATGRNACSLHYTENRGKIAAGDLVLLDTGVCLDGYNSDITRTFPVDGRFTSRQREIYEVVLAALEAATAMAAPGADLGAIHACAWDVIHKAGFSRYFIHGTSHFIGMDTHDVGDRYVPLEPGALFTVEPGIYIPEEGIGIRLEDEVLVTAAGHEVLSAALPRKAEEIEEILAGR